MKTGCRLGYLAALCLPLVLTGCSLFPTTRKLPMPKAPTITKTATPEELIDGLNKRWDALSTLTATVEIQATVIKTKEGSEKDYPTAHGHILLRKPADLRVLGSYLGMRIFDMVSNGKEFTVSILSEKKVIKGSTQLSKKSDNPIENLRPDFFLDALLVRGVDPSDEYMVTADTLTIEDPARKHLYSIPEYKLTVMRPKPGPRKLTPLRVVYFHREDLMPYQQDIYDEQGNLETQVFYYAYQDFDSSKFPSSIVIKRPIEGIQINLTVDDVKENQPLTDDQFVPTIAEGSTIQKIE